MSCHAVGTFKCKKHIVTFTFNQAISMDRYLSIIDAVEDIVAGIEDTILRRIESDRHILIEVVHNSELLCQVDATPMIRSITIMFSKSENISIYPKFMELISYLQNHRLLRSFI